MELRGFKDPKKIILGYILQVPQRVKELVITEKFFTESLDRAFFNEAKKGTEAPLIADNLTNNNPDKKAELELYITRLQLGLQYIKTEALQQMINKEEIKGLRKKHAELINKALKTGAYDWVKIDKVTEQIRKIKNRGKGPNVISFLDVKSKPLDWLWHNKIPANNLSLIVGDPGAGKSLLTLWIAAKISKGQDWPDAKNNDPGSVIILSAEDNPEDTIKVRLEQVKADCSKIHQLYPAEFTLKGVIKELDSAIKEIPDIRAIIIDPISSYMQGIKGSDNIGVRSALAPLSELANKNSITILAVQHLNKDQAKKAIYRTMDSVAYTAAARSVWLVQKDEDSEDFNRRLFVPLKANNCKNPTTLAFRIDGPLGLPAIHFESDPVNVNANELLADEETKDRFSAKEEAKHFIREALKDGPVEADQMDKWAKDNGISPATLNRAKPLVGAKSYQENKQWWWKLEV